MVNKMIKRILIIILLVFTIVFLYQHISWGAEKVSYDLGNGYIAVREDVFNNLVTNDKLLELAKKEKEYYESSLKELQAMNSERFLIQENRIGILKDTLVLKDEKISLKDENLKKFEELYNIKSKEVRKFKANSLFEKFLTLGIGVWAVSEIDDNNARIGIGATTLYLVFK